MVAAGAAATLFLATGGPDALDGKDAAGAGFAEALAAPAPELYCGCAGNDEDDCWDFGSAMVCLPPL